MTAQTSAVRSRLPDRMRVGRSGCCGSAQKSSGMKWLMVAVGALLFVGLATGSTMFGFAAIAPLLYVLPCLAMCGMCLFKHRGAAKC